ncbi:hypothetical protein ZWY2020_040626 [Hordeum vulgare]|nr:hypothetical protein ZWY2020_040626 [Hordeum vulgare]
MAAAAAAAAATSTESARAAVLVVDISLAQVESIHANIEDAHAKIFQATSESSMQTMSEKAAKAMEHLLPHEIAERELEMHEASGIDEHLEEELRMAEDELEKIFSVKELAVEYQRKLWHIHYYEYHNLEGEDDDVVDFS